MYRHAFFFWLGGGGAKAVLSILQKCVWYALTVDNIQANLGLAMWGVGIKGYPTRWWLLTLRRFYHSTTMEIILPP